MKQYAADHGTGVLVIGYGNALRGDDALGLRVADRLAETFASECETGNMTVTPTHQLTFDLAEAVSRARCVILVDAATGDQPGTIACRSITPQRDGTNAMLHHMQPEALLASAAALYGSVPPTFLWTVTGEQFDVGAQLSPAVQAALPALETQLTTFVRRILDTSNADSTHTQPVNPNTGPFRAALLEADS